MPNQHTTAMAWEYMRPNVLYLMLPFGEVPLVDAQCVYPDPRRPEFWVPPENVQKRPEVLPDLELLAVDPYEFCAIWRAPYVGKAQVFMVGRSGAYITLDAVAESC
jgi:hypothetical protein